MFYTSPQTILNYGYKCLVEGTSVLVSNGSFPLRGTAQHGSGRFVFPLQFSNILEWAGLFSCRYSGAASTAVTPEKRFISASLHQSLAGSAPRLSLRGLSVLPQQTTKQTFFWLFKKGALIQNNCVRSFAGGADLNLAGLLCLKPQVQ